MPQKKQIDHQYYVCEGTGIVCSTAAPPEGCHFEFKDKLTHQVVWVVADKDFEVLQEAVLWPSLDALQAAGVDTSNVRV